MVRNAFIIFLFLLIGIASYFSNDIAPFIGEPIDSEQEAKLILSDCSISESSCLVNIGIENTLTLDLQPKPLPVMETLFVVLRVGEGLLFQKAWFEGRDMNMGKHYLLPDNDSKKVSDNQIILKGMIPVCHIENSMTWRLVVEFVYKQELIQIHFEQNIIAE